MLLLLHKSVEVQVVNNWPTEKRLQFLQFVTGASRPCLPEMEELRIAMPFTARRAQEWPRVLRMLPQVNEEPASVGRDISSHTAFEAQFTTNDRARERNILCCMLFYLPGREFRPGSMSF